MTDSLKGRRLGAVVYAPRAQNAGDLWYVDTDGRLTWLDYPAGAALGDYVLATGDDDHPVWMLAGGAGMVPTFIASGATFTVPDNKQALYAMTIDNEGTIDIGDNAYLVMVD